ncbi:hypothetical protein F4561_002858 [Lipingzhangella halophila]|uniref:Uncharacterized protein n=1 Tax=Lipingzhangella halophila TaxID=1783352 RepID=A0A7W7W319_9ACTN|nr:hypothetical protein [Lipingzhangella halophila]MBB4932038.1 hypothetical protein [Lipingzhangella halophila]
MSNVPARDAAGQAFVVLGPVAALREDRADGPPSVPHTSGAGVRGLRRGAQALDMAEHTAALAPPGCARQHRPERAQRGGRLSRLSAHNATPASTARVPGSTPLSSKDATATVPLPTPPSARQFLLL